MTRSEVDDVACNCKYTELAVSTRLGRGGPGVVQEWSRGGPGVAKGWFMGGPGVVQEWSSNWSVGPSG